jgi:phosphohistidine phosphatase SixA
MPLATVSTTAASAVGKTTRKRRSFLGLFAVLLMALFTGWMLRPSTALDLGHGHRLQQAGVLSEWAAGNMVVFVRHAERCDRSHNLCLGDPTGITADGARVAATAGQALEAMGLHTTDVVSSPLVRTVQTSEAMFARAAQTVTWLQDCRRPAVKDVMALKKPGRNLVVVTHSGCIDRYESQLDVGSTPASGYVSALFVSQRDNAPAKALGYLDAPAWQAVLNQATK